MADLGDQEIGFVMPKVKRSKPGRQFSEFDNLVVKYMPTLLKLATKIGGPVLKICEITSEAFFRLKCLLVEISEIEEPTPDHVQKFLAPLNELITEASTLREEGTSLVNSAIDSLITLKWVECSAESRRKPAEHVEDCLKNAGLLKNMIPKEAKWALALKNLYLPGMRNYVDTHYPLGPSSSEPLPSNIEDDAFTFTSFVHVDLFYFCKHINSISKDGEISRLSELHIFACDGYQTFAIEVYNVYSRVYKVPSFQEIKRTINILYPWPLHSVNYIDMNGEELNPLTMSWETFLANLESINFRWRPPTERSIKITLFIDLSTETSHFLITKNIKGFPIFFRTLQFQLCAMLHTNPKDQFDSSLKDLYDEEEERKLRLGFFSAEKELAVPSMAWRVANGVIEGDNIQDDWSTFERQLCEIKISFED